MNTKLILPWLKAHWPIPALLFVAIVALPTAWFFAESMKDSQRAEFEAQFKKDADSISESASKISYSIPAVDGAGKVLEQSKPANEEMIRAYGKVWEAVQSKVGGVAELGLNFNKGNHKLLIEGVFPKPAEDGQSMLTVKGREFVRAYIDFHAQLLNRAKAGSPPPPAKLAQQLTDIVTAQVDKIKAESGRDPNDEEKANIAKEAMEARMSAYRNRATEIAFYAEPNVFEGVPSEVPDKPPTLAQMWDWQERSWVHQDIIDAIRSVAGESGAGVSQSIVKRLIKLSVKNANWDPSAGVPAANPFETGDDKVALDFTKSITGRTSGYGTKNKWYDIRQVELEFVASSQRLPAFIDALAKINFMTVVDLDLSRVEPLNDLREGYFYGDEHVVRVSMVVETIWLREWRKAAMPEDVQRTLGMSEAVSADGVQAASPSPAPAARPKPAAAGANKPAPGGAARPGGRPVRDN